MPLLKGRFSENLQERLSWCRCSTLARRARFSRASDEAREELASPDSHDGFGLRAFGAELDFTELDVASRKSHVPVVFDPCLLLVRGDEHPHRRGFPAPFRGDEPTPTLETRMCFTTLVPLLPDCERSTEHFLLVRNRHDNRASDISNPLVTA